MNKASENTMQHKSKRNKKENIAKIDMNSQHLHFFPHGAEDKKQQKQQPSVKFCKVATVPQFLRKK